MASPSGSDADTVKVISVPSAPEAVAGATTTGGRSPSVIVISVVAEPERAFEAVKVTLYVPVCVLVGVHEKVPEVFAAFFVNVAPAGRGAAVRLVIASPSGSTAGTVNVSRTFVGPLTDDGAVTTGARSVLVIVIVVVAEPERAFDALNVTLYVPACVKDGVHDNVPDVLAAFLVNDASNGSPSATRLVSASPSGSAAVTVKVISVFSAPEAVAGAVTTGARSQAQTVIA